MSDVDLRRLERRWRQIRSVESECAYLKCLLREGLLGIRMLRAAAAVQHAAAREALRPDHLEQSAVAVTFREASILHGEDAVPSIGDLTLMYECIEDETWIARSWLMEDVSAVLQEDAVRHACGAGTALAFALRLIDRVRPFAEDGGSTEQVFAVFDEEFMGTGFASDSDQDLIALARGIAYSCIQPAHPAFLAENAHAALVAERGLAAAIPSREPPVRYLVDRLLGRRGHRQGERPRPSNGNT